MEKNEIGACYEGFFMLKPFWSTRLNLNYQDAKFMLLSINTQATSITSLNSNLRKRVYCS